MSDLKTESLKKYMENVLIAEGHDDWQIIPTSTDGLCCVSRKEIWIGKNVKDDEFMYLHEIAHIRFPDHEAEWGDHFTNLCRRYADLPEIKECPFCKQDGTLGVCAVMPTGFEWFVSCLNDNCLVEISTVGFETPREAILTWNDRRVYTPFPKRDTEGG